MALRAFSRFKVKTPLLFISSDKTVSFELVDMDFIKFCPETPFRMYESDGLADNIFNADAYINKID